MKNLLRLIFIALVLVLLNAPAVAQLSVAPPPKSVTISSGVMAGMLLEKTNPVYPPIAKAAHVSGTVVLQATITKAGMIENLHVISGPDLLQQAALEAVKDWRYRPYLLMGEPVEVQTTVNVIFTLGGSLPQSSPDAGSQEAAPPLAQTTAVPPPPMPAPDGPSLAATMQFIQDKLQERGRLNFAVYTHDNADGKDYIDQYSSEASNIVADPAACSINYHRNVKKNGAVFADDNVSFSFRDVQDLAVMPEEQEFKRAYAADGHPTWEPRVDPPLFLVVARRAANQANGFFFPSEELANRLAKAMLHAVELCGGGSKDPF
jgi:TonB family protein